MDGPLRDHRGGESRPEGARPGTPSRTGARRGERLSPLDRHVVVVVPVVQPVLAAVAVYTANAAAIVVFLLATVQLTEEGNEGKTEILPEFESQRVTY